MRAESPFYGEQYRHGSGALSTLQHVQLCMTNVQNRPVFGGCTELNSLEASEEQTVCRCLEMMVFRLTVDTQNVMTAVSLF